MNTAWRIALCFLVSLLSAACSDPRGGPVAIDHSDQLEHARYALLFGNIAGGHRMDGSAEGVLWFIDQAGVVVAESSRFSPLVMASLRRSGDSVYFFGDGAGYQVDSGGLTTYPRDHPYGSLSLMEVLPSGEVLGVLNAGAPDEGGYSMMVLNLADPSADLDIDRYVEAIAACGSETYLLTTEGLEPSGGRWERLGTGDVVSGHGVEVTYNLTTAMAYPCQDSQVFAVEWIAEEERMTEIRLVSWDVAASFARSSIALTDAEGRTLGGGQTWQDGSRFPYHFWLIDDDLLWINLAGELWRSDIDSGLSEIVFAADPAPGARSGSLTPQESSFVRAIQEPEHIRVSEYDVRSGELISEVLVNHVPQPADMLVTDAVTLDW